MKLRLFAYVLLAALCVNAGRAAPDNQPDGNATTAETDKADQPAKNAKKETTRQKVDYDKSAIQPALVLINGANGSGTGFICKIRGIPFVVTNIHVLACADAADSYGAGLDKLNALTLDGNQLTLQSIYGCRDHDLAILRFAEENDYQDIALEFDANVVRNTQSGDPIVIPGNSQGAGTMVWTEGEVVGIGPTKVEHDAPIYKGNSGSPIINLKTGKVIGVLSYAELVDTDNFLDEASYNDEKSAIKKDVRYFGYRLDSGKDWYAISLPRFCQQYQEYEDFVQQRQSIAIFLYTDSADWRADLNLGKIIDDANEQIRDRSIAGRIDNDSFRGIVISASLRINSLIKNDTYRAYQQHLRAYERNPQNASYYPYFNEFMEREVSIRDLLAKNNQDWEKRVRRAR